jgi:hypothetical protein
MADKAGGVGTMAERRLRTAQRKKRARARFWQDHGEKIRVGLIATAMVLVAVFVAKKALGS